MSNKIAWLAGLIDGEGCITINRHKSEKRKGCMKTLEAAQQVAAMAMK